MFRAHEPGRDRLVAIKVFRLEITPEQAASLARDLEQLIAKDIAHRNVAAPISAGIDGYAAYLALEYVVGDSLDVSTRGMGPMPLTEVVPIVDGIASAIDACAARGVGHGLLHPRDVIMSADGPRVTGFGIADALARLGLRPSVRRPYAAPEGPSDVYALAAIAYELISGRRMTPSGWDELSAEDGPALRDAFASALSPDPKARPATAGEFAANLRAGSRSSFASGFGEANPPHAAGHTGVDESLESEFPPEPETIAAPVSLGLDAAPDPEFDTGGLDRFAEAGAESDLHLDVMLPPELPEVEAPHTPSWSGQPAGLFQTDDAPAGHGGGARFAILLLLALAVASVAGYAAYRWKAGRAAAPAAQAAPAKPPVATTTVDVPPPARAELPPEAALPAPAPSRPASGVTSAPPARSAPEGRLLIRSTPADAAVAINGEPRGKTPLTLRNLPPGSYTIHVTRNGFAAADRRVRLTERRPSESIEISLKPEAPATTPTAGGETTGGLTVESRPPGARVFMNDRLIGSTPLAIPGLPVGPATVRIEMDGYQTWVTTINVSAGQQLRVGASLDRN